MNLSPQEIINIEIKLLQSPGKTLTTLHKYHLMQKTDYQNIIFKEFDKKTISPKLKKMIISNVNALKDDPNSNLKAFSIVILKLIFLGQDKEQILWTLKSYLHQFEIDLKKFYQIPKFQFFQDLMLLSKSEVKKILVEFFYLLKNSSEQNKIQKQCKKYPLALQLLTFFWRTILSHLESSQVYNYQKRVSTQTCFRKLFDFFDIFYGRSQKLYFFHNQNLFIQEGYENQNKQFVDEIVIGEYYENDQQYLKNKMKNYDSPLCFNTDDLKFSAQTFNPNYLKSKNLNKVNPFQLIIPEDSSSIILGKKDMKTSNSSLKSSNAFQKRRFNLPSNRSDHTINLEDSQCDNPTPSFNHVTQDEARDLFQPQNQSLNKIKNQCSTRGTNAPFNMKQSATIISFQNKLLKSSLLKENNRKLKGFLQILPQKTFQFGNQQLKNHTRIKTEKNQFTQKFKMSPLLQKLQSNTKNKLFEEQKRSMRRSKSQKNSMIRQSQVINEDETNRVSLFDINCKKLKTSMQIDEFDFLSQKQTIICITKNLDDKYFNQICENSAYTCSCSSIKLQRNSLNTNIFAFKYEPQNLLSPDFKKKKQGEQNQNDKQDKNFKKKSKLNDDFFKKLRAKRQELKTLNPKTKSDPKHKSKQQQRHFKKPYFTKYSQFIKLNQRNHQKQKSPDKNTFHRTKTTFPSTLQNFHNSFDNFSTKKSNQKNPQQNNSLYSLKNTQKQISLNKIRSFKEGQKRKYKHMHHNPSFQQNFYKMYSTPVTPNQNAFINQEQENFIRINTNTSLQEIISPQKNFSNGIRKTSFKVFQHQNNYGFGKSDSLFINPPI